MFSTTSMKALGSLESITVYISALLIASGVGLLYELRQLLASVSKDATSLWVTTLAFICCGLILVWCLRLLAQRNANVFWAFLAFGLADLGFKLANRLICGGTLFTSSDLVVPVGVAGISVALHRLARSGILH